MTRYIDYSPVNVQVFNGYIEAKIREIAISNHLHIRTEFLMREWLDIDTNWLAIFRIIELHEESGQGWSVAVEYLRNFDYDAMRSYILNDSNNIITESGSDMVLNSLNNARLNSLVETYSLTNAMKENIIFLIAENNIWIDILENIDTDKWHSEIGGVKYYLEHPNTESYQALKDLAGYESQAFTFSESLDFMQPPLVDSQATTVAPPMSLSGSDIYGVFHDRRSIDEGSSTLSAESADISAPAAMTPLIERSDTNPWRVTAESTLPIYVIAESSYSFDSAEGRPLSQPTTEVRGASNGEISEAVAQAASCSQPYSCTQNPVESLKLLTECIDEKNGDAASRADSTATTATLPYEGDGLVSSSFSYPPLVRCDEQVELSGLNCLLCPASADPI